MSDRIPYARVMRRPGDIAAAPHSNSITTANLRRDDHRPFLPSIASGAANRVCRPIVNCRAGDNEDRQVQLVTLDDFFQIASRVVFVSKPNV